MLFVRRWIRNAKALVKIIVRYCKNRARSDDYYDKTLVAKIKERIRIRKVRKDPTSLPKNLLEYCSYGVQKQGYFYRNGKKLYHKNEVFKYCRDNEMIIYFDMNDKCVGPYQVIKINNNTLVLMSRFNQDFLVTR